MGSRQGSDESPGPERFGRPSSSSPERQGGWPCGGNLVGNRLVSEQSARRGTPDWLMIPRMNENSACPECGSKALVASGVFEHGTWILRLTCWTCRDCRSIVAIPESEIGTGDAVGAHAAGSAVRRSD
jgi:hypothetical protein